MYISDILRTEFLKTYNNTILISKLINIILLLLKISYNSQVRIGLKIFNFQNINDEFKSYIMREILDTTLDKTFDYDALESYYDIILKYDLKRNIAATCIQKSWKEVISNPMYRVCRTRLLLEFKLLLNV